MDEIGDSHSFSDDQWSALGREIGAFAHAPATVVDLLDSGLWFTAYGPPPGPVAGEQRQASEADFRIHLEGQMWLARERALMHDDPSRHTVGSATVKAIAEQADRLIQLLQKHRQQHLFLTPRIDGDPILDRDFADEELTRFIPRLEIGLARASEFYSELARKYEASALFLQNDNRPIDICRDIYWGELLKLWTTVLSRAPTSSPNGPLSRFIHTASAPMAKRLRPSPETIHRFARDRLRLVQSASR